MKPLKINKTMVMNMDFEQAYRLYTPLIVSQAKKHEWLSDYEDMFQEASIALWKAYKNYNSANGTTFGHYAKKVIFNHMKNLEVTNHREKRNLGDSIISLDFSPKPNCTIGEVIESNCDVEATVLTNGLIRELRKLDSFKVWAMLLMGYKWREIAEKLGIKTVNITRMRRKNREVLREWKD